MVGPTQQNGGNNTNVSLSKWSFKKIINKIITDNYNIKIMLWRVSEILDRYNKKKLHSVASTFFKLLSSTPIQRK